MVYVHTYSELDNAFKRFGHFKFFQMRRPLEPNSRSIVDALQSYGHLNFFAKCVNWT